MDGKKRLLEKCSDSREIVAVKNDGWKTEA